MENYTVPLDPETELYCTLHLFTNVLNTSEMRVKILNKELECCAVKAGLIVDPFQLIVAANKAAVNFKLGQLITKTLYTELLFSLSTSKSIGHSLAEFGIGDNDNNIVIAIIHKVNENSVSTNLSNVIKGELIPIKRLSEFTDGELVRKLYKIEKEELNVSSLLNVIISKMCCKDFASIK